MQWRSTAAGKGLILLAAFGLLSFSFPYVALAGIESDPNLTKLELKFFEHDYSKEDAAARLERLEKLVFGEKRSGDEAARLKNLVAAVPNLDAPAASTADAGKGSAAESQPTAQTPSRRTPAHPAANDEDISSREQQMENASQYPQVSAMEKRLLGHDFAGEPIIKRLDRLETKAFGKPTPNGDLSDRVDRLKERTGIDLAKSPPPGSDWSDDDENPMGGNSLTYVPAETTPYSGSKMPQRRPADDYGNNDFNGSSRGYGGGSSGSYGGGSAGSYGGGSSGSYGMGGSSAPPVTGAGPHGGGYGYNPPKIASAHTPRTAPPSLVPQPAPDVVHEPPVAPPAAVGLNQRVSMLENDLFNKTFGNDTLPSRVTRLENTVFPGKRTPPDMSLPERVARLVDVVGPGQTPTATNSATGRKVAQRPDDDDPQMPKPAPPRGSGLSRMLNGLGNLVTGGGYGSYSMNSNLVTDPQSGMLVDMYSGNIIDPRTGAVIGNRGAGMPVTPYGGSPYSGFNNGLSPIGTPYGGMGMGGTGMRFGVGGGRGMGIGTGMGFGTGIGGMGMGVWP